MLKFIKGKDTLRDQEIIEVWLFREGKEPVFVAGIYPHETSINVVSKYLTEVKKDDVFPPSAVINFEVP